MSKWFCLTSAVALAALGPHAFAEPAPAPTPETAAPATAPAPAAAAPAPIPAATAPASPAPVPATNPATDTAAPAPAPATAAAPPQEEALGAEVRRNLAALASGLDDAGRADAEALAAFYEARRDEPLWVTKTGLDAKAALVVAELGRAGDWGLEAADYDVSTLPAADAELSRDQLAAAETALSRLVLAYARHARGGRIADPARQLSSYLDRAPQLRDPRAILEEIAGDAAPDAYLRGLHPNHAQFEKLRRKLLEMRKSAAAVEIVTLPPGPALVPGQSHPHVALLRKRLKVAVPARADNAETDAADPETVYDEALAAAVKDYQKQEGLGPDAIVGPGTRAALNAVDAPSPAKLVANMEQWRWMPDDLGPLHVAVNIPEFTLRVVKDGEVIHEERVITGLVDKQTPVFSDVIKLVTFHPRWFVPDSIKVRELYPSLARGGTYFARQNLKLTRNGRPVDPESVDWGSADIRQFDVHQPPGGGNVLGVLKFSFPNKHLVYMHDTPTRGLFNEKSRTFSHGCVRVRDPARLAEILLAADKGWDAAKVASIINGPAVENPVTLDRPIPVHVTYFTRWIDDAGAEQSASDVYGHERRMLLALEGRFGDIARGPDHLAPVTYGAARYASSKNTSFDTFMSNFFGGF